jgi:hypothetical protein
MYEYTYRLYTQYDNTQCITNIRFMEMETKGTETSAESHLKSGQKR